MTEAARPLDQDQASLAASWDMSALSWSLDVAAEARIDVAHGEGVAYRLGPGPGTLLELFPATGTVRLTGQDVQLTLFRQDPPRLADEGLVFELATEPRRRWLSVSPTTGEVLLFYDPSVGEAVCAPETAQDASEPAERPKPLHCKFAKFCLKI